jgi:hypothetical protein
MQCVSDRAGHVTGILILVGGFLLVVGSTPLSCEISGCFLGGCRRRNLGQVFWILGLFGAEGSYLSWPGRWAICANEAGAMGIAGVTSALVHRSDPRRESCLLSGGNAHGWEGSKVTVRGNYRRPPQSLLSNLTGDNVRS